MMATDNPAKSDPFLSDISVLGRGVGVRMASLASIASIQKDRKRTQLRGPSVLRILPWQ